MKCEKIQTEGYIRFRSIHSWKKTHTECEIFGMLREDVW